MAPSRREVLGTLGGIGAGSLAGCTSGSNTGGAQDTTTTTQSTTTTTQSSSSATVQMRSHSELGDILVDGDGMTLYMFDKDTKGEAASTCYDSCADNWPPLISDEPEAGSGVMASLSTFERENGDVQVAANGWPLYYFTPDSSPDDVKGQGVGDVWWVLDPTGKPIKGSASSNSVSTTLETRSHPEYGDYLVDSDGMALYMFDKDTKGSGASTCYNGCADNWPPLTGNDPKAGDGVTASLSTFERKNGDTQIAANGWPLYYFASDSSAGDINGQAVGDVWWLLDPSGKPIKGSSGTTTTSDGYDY